MVGSCPGLRWANDPVTVSIWRYSADSDGVAVVRFTDQRRDTWPFSMSW